MFTFSAGNAQQKTVSGTVLDDLGGPLSGATVVVDGTTRGSTSDSDGNYSIEASLGMCLSLAMLVILTNESLLEAKIVTE